MLDVMSMMGICKPKAYEVFNSGQFHVVKVGRKYMVHKEVFENWLKVTPRPKKDGDTMKTRKRLITEDTVIEINEEVFKIKAEELLCELFVDYVNKKYGYTVLELKIKEVD